MNECELIRVFDATDTEDKYKGSMTYWQVVHGTLQVNFSCINAEQEFLIENFIFQCISTNFCFELSFYMLFEGVQVNISQKKWNHVIRIASICINIFIYQLRTIYEQQQKWKVYVCYHFKIKPQRKKSLTSKFLSQCPDSKTSVIPNFMYTYLYANFITSVYKNSCITFIHPNTMTYSIITTN